MNFDNFYNQIIEKPESVIAFCALILSLFAIIIPVTFSYWQIRIQRRHNRKSLIPIGYIDFGDFEDRLYVKISNYGAGPLIVKEVLFSKDNIQKNSLVEMINTDVMYSNFIQFFSNKTISPNSSLFVIDINFDDNPNTVEKRDEIRDILKHIIASVKYTNVYDDEFTTTRNLDWFGRTRYVYNEKEV